MVAVIPVVPVVAGVVAKRWWRWLWWGGGGGGEGGGDPRSSLQRTPIASYADYRYYSAHPHLALVARHLYVHRSIVIVPVHVTHHRGVLAAGLETWGCSLGIQGSSLDTWAAVHNHASARREAVG